MASCLRCSEYIDPRRWTCEKCDEKAIKYYEYTESIKKKPKGKGE